MTYRDLLERLKRMTDSHLDQKAQMLGDGYSGDLIRVHVFSCDQVQDEDYWSDTTDFDEEELKDMEIVAHKGDVFLLGN